MQISFSPNITSIYILYKANFTSCSAPVTGCNFCIDLRTESNVFVTS